MHKHLLYICFIVFTCLACTEEVKEDNSFIEFILSEADDEQREENSSDSFTEGLSKIEDEGTTSNKPEKLVDEKLRTTVIKGQTVTKPSNLKNKKLGEDNYSFKKSQEKENNNTRSYLELEKTSKTEKKQSKLSEIDTIMLDEVWVFKKLKNTIKNNFSKDYDTPKNIENQNINANIDYKLSNNSKKEFNKKSIIKDSSTQVSLNYNTRAEFDNKLNRNNASRQTKTLANLYKNKHQTQIKKPQYSPLNTNKSSISKTNQNPKNSFVNGSKNLNGNNAVSTYTITYEQPKINKLFTDPSEHSKQYKTPTTIELKGGQIDYKNKSRSGDNTFEIVEKAYKFNDISKDYNQQTLAQKKDLSSYNNPRIGSKKIQDNAPVSIKLLNKNTNYKTNKTYTLIAQLTNKGQPLEDLYIEPYFPKEWRIISISQINDLKTNERKVCLISFYIPTQFSPGEIEMYLALKSRFYTLKNHDFTLNIKENHNLDVFHLASPKQLQAGELIESTYGIKNNGNTDQQITLSSKNDLEGENTIVIPKDSTVVVKVNQKTDKKANSFRRIGTNLEVTNIKTKEKYYKSNSTDIIPSSIKQKDPYFRYLMDASLYYSSYTKKDYHYSILSAEVKGNGFLDLDKNHHLNFIVRAPKKQNLRRFNVVDQYSLIYQYKDSTTLYLGDHAYDINRLGYGNRYGMGFRIDHNVKKWTLSAFYSKPRLYDFNDKPLYGVKAVYNQSDSLKIGLALEKSEGNTYSYQNILNEDGKGQIATLDYYYKNNNTYLDAEMSASFNSNNLDYASRLDFTQRFKGISFNSTLTYAGKNYLGVISNSLQLSTGLSYYKNRFNFGLGHAISRVNRRLDPVLFEVEPYFENIFATFGYRFGSKHNVSFRFDKRIREDQLDPINYKYQEYGFDYRFNYSDKLFTGSFGGRFAKTQNLLIGNQDFRNTYTHDLNVSYRILNSFNIRGALNHTLTNRYGYSGLIQNYYRYNLGFNYNASRSFRVSANYNSGFSPEENYRKRDYINLNLNARINQRHSLQIRANYFENPTVINNKELQAFAKYTYSFGVGIKRLYEQGGIEGFVTTNNGNINTKGIKMFTNGKTVVTDKYGNFELNNLEVGTNYIYLDESSLPMDIVMAKKNPIEVIVEKDKKTIVDVLLVKAGQILGNLHLTNKNKAIAQNLDSYVKLENEEFTYYAESDKNGNFIFKNIVPGDYSFSVIRFKNNEKLFSVVKNTSITVPEAVITELHINVKGKERKIRFKNNNLKVAYYD